MHLTFKIDVDGVIRDLPSSMCRVYNSIADNKEKTINDITYYDVNKSFSDVLSLTGQTASEYFFTERSTDVFRLMAKPYKGVSEALMKLSKQGHKIIICTWQPSYQAKLDTLGFLEDWSIPYDDIFFSNEKWRIYGDYIIDDNPDFLLNEEEEACKVLIRHPYNKKQQKLFTNVYGSIAEFLESRIFAKKLY